MGGHKNLFWGHTGVVGDCDLLAGRCVSIFSVALTVGPCRAVLKKFFFFQDCSCQPVQKKKKVYATFKSLPCRYHRGTLRTSTSYCWMVLVYNSEYKGFFFLLFLFCLVIGLTISCDTCALGGAATCRQTVSKLAHT